MVTEEEVKQRYTQTEAEVDARGRTIVVGKLKLSQQVQINEFTDKPVNQVIYQMVGSVRHIDVNGSMWPIGVPATREKMLQNLDLLGEEGMDALTKAYRRLHGLKDDPAESEPPNG